MRNLFIALGLLISHSLGSATLPAAWLQFEKDPYARFVYENPKTGPRLGLFLWSNHEVAHVAFGSGAERAGLRPGDQVLNLEGPPAARRIRFRRGNHIRTAVAKPRAATLSVRAKAVRFEDGSAEGRISVESFEEGTCALVARSVKALTRVHVTALELDLRNNPGGLLKEAACVAGLFLGAGHPFTYFEPAEKTAHAELRLTRGSFLTGLPLRLLVNEGTASSAEILAAALQDTHRALLVGQLTYGKGTVQAFSRLRDPTFSPEGIWLEHTTHRALRIDGRPIHLAGIQPQLTR